MFNASWQNAFDKIINAIEGERNGNIGFRIRRLVSLPFRIVNKIIKNGFGNTIKFGIQKYLLK